MVMQPLSPTLWRTCRAIANETRIGLLRALVSDGETSVTELGGRTGISQPHASAHLRLLNSRGLISARANGKWVFYRAAPNPHVEHAARILSAMEECFSRSDLHDADIFRIATAFTHERRIRIVQQLYRCSLTDPELARRTQIPLSSLHRHLAKLSARDMIDVADGCCALRFPVHPLAQTLLGIATAA